MRLVTGIGDNGGTLYSWYHMTKCIGGPRINIIPSALESGVATIDNKVLQPDECVTEGLVHLNDVQKLLKIDDKLESTNINDLMCIMSRDLHLVDMCPIKIDSESYPENWEYVKVTIHFQQVMFDKGEADGDNSNTK